MFLKSSTEVMGNASHEAHTIAQVPEIFPLSVTHAANEELKDLTNQTALEKEIPHCLSKKGNKKKLKKQWN